MGQHFVMMECGTLAHSDVCFRTSAPPRAPVNYWRGPVSRGHNTNINPNCKPYPYRGYIVDVRNGSFEGAAAGVRSRLRSYGYTVYSFTSEGQNSGWRYNRLPSSSLFVRLLVGNITRKVLGWFVVKFAEHGHGQRKSCLNFGRDRETIFYLLPYL